MKAIARAILAVLALCATPVLAQVPSFPQTLPANTVVGRLGIGPGPSQAIPFAVLRAQLVTSFTVKYLKDPAFGYVADGVTDNRAALNLAIAYANATSGRVTFIVPCGVGLVAGTTSLTAIIVSYVSFVGECGSAGSRINPIDNTSAGLFVWGNASVQPTEGGIFGLGFDGNASATQLLINLPNAARLKFIDINISNVGGLIQAGVSGGTTANGFTVSQLVGMFANVAVTKINLVNGSGAYIENAKVFTNAANVAAVTSGSNFVAAFTKGWDTLRVTDSIAELFAFPVFLQATSGVAINNVQISNNYFDASRLGVAFVASAGGTMYGVHLLNNELTSSAGNCLEFSGAGANFGHLVVGNRIIQCGNHGVSGAATLALTTFSANQVYGVNQLASSSDAFNFAAGHTDLTFTGNNAGFVTASPLNGTPRYGFNIGNGTNVLSANNKGAGSTAGCLLGTLTTSRWQNNQGTGCGNTPVYTVAEGGTGQSTIAAAQAAFGYPLILGGFALNVDLNAIADTAITITSPTTRYQIVSIHLNNKGTTASLTTARAGLFSSAGGAGLALAADQVLSAITSNAVNTDTNTMFLTATIASRTYLDDTSLFFRVGTAQGAAATGDVYVFIRPMP